MLMMEKTKEIRLKQSDLVRIRENLKVCSHCGAVFSQEHSGASVCEPCVKEAMENEGFKYE